ncbi:glycosyltransferase family 4 protein [Amylibacter sp.]|nr:glycosyltransferase family 4 protein [Amylibacter sp.]
MTKSIVIISDTFPPLRTSGAVQLNDLSLEFIKQGYDVTVLLPSSNAIKGWSVEEYHGVELVRLKVPKTKDVNYKRRTLSEFLMPHAMRRNLKKSPLAEKKWDAIIWYSPSIFLGPLVKYIKKKSACKSYLIIRDIFPEWALDMGLIGRGLGYWFFSTVANYQYSVADIIGVQTSGNKIYFHAWKKIPGRRLEVLSNWLGERTNVECSIVLDNSKLAGRKIFVYAGNMGIAQGVDILLELAEKMSQRSDVGFIFVGRGSELTRLKRMALQLRLENTLFYDEIEPDEILQLYNQCSVGLVSLAHAHKSHNIPGKFLSYMQAGMPVLANVNRSNDLISLIRTEGIGAVSDTNNCEELYDLATKLLEKIDNEVDYKTRCKALFEINFNVRNTVIQLMSALSKK